jgi:glycosyltransferase involved in cell wall biosynthesis
MKILHVLGQAADVGGILSVVRNLQEATREQGITHAVYVHQNYRETRQPALDYRLGRYCVDEEPNPFRLMLRGLRASGELLRLLAAEPFDVVHGHFRGMLPALLRVATFHGRPVLFTNHAYARRTALYRRLARHRRITTVLLSQNMARHYRLEPCPPKISLVPDCCEDRFFTAPLVVRRAPGSAADRRVRLVGLGSVVDWKKWDVLLEALALLPPTLRRGVEFHHYGTAVDLPGSHDLERSLRRQAQVLDHGRVAVLHGSTRDVEGVLRSADWFVLPSTDEPCSVALSEAMALGLPALVSASGGCVDLVENGRTGLWFQPDNARDLAENLQRILLGQMVPLAPEAIRESARWRSASAAAAQYTVLYRGLAEGRPAGRGD